MSIGDHGPAWGQTRANDHQRSTPMNDQQPATPAPDLEELLTPAEARALIMDTFKVSAALYYKAYRPHLPFKYYGESIHPIETKRLPYLA